MTKALLVSDVTYTSTSPHCNSKRLHQKPRNTNIDRQMQHHKQPSRKTDRQADSAADTETDTYVHVHLHKHLHILCKYIHICVHTYLPAHLPTCTILPRQAEADRQTGTHMHVTHASVKKCDKDDGHAHPHVRGLLLLFQLLLLRLLH